MWNTESAMFQANSKYYGDEEDGEGNSPRLEVQFKVSNTKVQMTESEVALERLIAERIGKLDCGFNPDADDCHFELDNDIFGVCDVDEEEEEEDYLGDGEEEDYRGSEETLQEELEIETEPPKRFMNLTLPPESRPKEGDLYYYGLSTDMVPPKHVHPDYPRDLKLRKTCNPKAPLKRKTMDNFKTEALAKFSPVNSKDNLLKETLTAVTSKSKILEGPERLCAPHLGMRELPPVATINDEIIVDYIDEYNIQMLLEYFLSLTLFHTPTEPFEYIANVANQMIIARQDPQAFKNLPRMLQLEHIKSVFRIYDRVGVGLISLAQYKSAMEVIGIIHYNAKPEGFDEDKVSEDTFVSEATKAVDHLIKSFMFKKQFSPDDPCEFVPQSKNAVN